MYKQIPHAVIYTRFSSHLQREESIDAQIRAIKEFAIRQHMVIVGEYIDRGVSATTDQRAEFLHMIEDARAGLFDTVLIHKYDRFARNRKDSVIYRELLHDYGVRVSSVTEYFPPDLPETVLFESIIDGMSEFYSRNLAREVQKGLMENALHAKHTGGRPPYGYDVDPSTMKYIINEFEAEAVRMIFEMHMQGSNYMEIAGKLNNAGFTTKNGLSFGRNSLHDILSNEKYCGYFIYNKSASKDPFGRRNGHAYKSSHEVIRIKNGIPAIITEADFQKSLHLLEIRKTRSVSPRAKETYLLSGKIICGECGSTYGGNRKSSDKGRRVYVSYRCTKKNGKICCKNGEVKRDDIEQLVLRKLQKFLSGKTKAEQLIQAYSKQLRASHARSYFHLKYCEEEMKEIKRQIENVVGILTKQPSDALIAQLNRLEEQQANYQYQLEKLEKDMTFHKISKEELNSAFLWASEILASNDADRYLELVDRCVRKIILTRDEIVIHWDMGLACEITDPQNSPFTCIVNRSELRRKSFLHKQI